MVKLILSSISTVKFIRSSGSTGLLLLLCLGRESLQGLAERIVATESLVFLAKQFELLQPYLEALIPATKKAFLLQFYSQVTPTLGNY